MNGEVPGCEDRGFKLWNELDFIAVRDSLLLQNYNSLDINLLRQ